MPKEVFFLEAVGKVMRIDGETAVVRIVRQSACSGNCSECSGCANRSMDTVARMQLKVDVGDRVVLESDTTSILLGMFVVFILPLILPITAYILAAKIGFGLWAAAFGLVLSILVIWMLSRSNWYIKRTQPCITRIFLDK